MKVFWENTANCSVYFQNVIVFCSWIWCFKVITIRTYISFVVFCSEFIVGAAVVAVYECGWYELIWSVVSCLLVHCKQAVSGLTVFCTAHFSRRLLAMTAATLSHVCQLRCLSDSPVLVPVSLDAQRSNPEAATKSHGTFIINISHLLK